MTFADWNVKLVGPSFLAWEPKGPPDKQIAVMMSGGVDSSVTAHLLKEAGWEVLGITMTIPVSCSVSTRGCCGADAAFVCNELGIPHYFVDVTQAFEKLIIEPFRRDYANARTPNPCVDCNTLLKFSLLWDFVRDTLTIEHFATGHYARVVKTKSQARLQRACDKAKDQSYFIYGISAEKLNNLVLPLGDHSKQQVREIAAVLNLSVADKAESMELCFAGEGDYRVVLDDRQKLVPGDITDMLGNKIGVHKGISNYTIGQRRGLGFAAGQPLYVGRINCENNTVALGTRQQLCRQKVIADHINVLIPELYKNGCSLFGKIRSGGTPSRCKIVAIDQDRMTIAFDDPQFAPCPGQKMVLYDSDDYVVAGGTIID